MTSSALGLVSYLRNMAAGRLDSEPDGMDVDEGAVNVEPELAELFDDLPVDAGSPEPDPGPAVGDIMGERTLPSAPPVSADNHPNPRFEMLVTGTPIIDIVERTVTSLGHTVEHIVSSVPPNRSVVPDDAVGTGAARAPRLTPKQRAAKGTKRIGIYTRHQIVCPQQPSGFIEVWLPHHGPHGEDFKRDMSKALTLFREGGFKQEEWFRFLKTRMRGNGWKLLDHENMPGPGFIRMLPAEWGKIDWPLLPAIQRRLKMSGHLVRPSRTSRPQS